ncbi:MAG TPA: RNA polymerase sigma factor [Gemmatimonadales bacterium]
MSASGDLELAAADLVPRAQRGDAAAREELLRRCHPVIYRWAVVQAGTPDDADDVAQEVLIRLHTSLHRYEGRSRFTTWLYQVTRNEALSLRRRLHSRGRLGRALGEEAQTVMTVIDDPVGRLSGERVTELIGVLLTALPRRQREVFALADLEDVDPAEIAVRLGMRPVTVRVHLFRARRALRAKLLERWPGAAAEARA